MKKLLIVLMLIGLGSIVNADDIKFANNKITQTGLNYSTILFNNQLYFIYNREKNQYLTSTEAIIELNVIKNRMCSNVNFASIIETYHPIFIYSAKNSTIMAQIDSCRN